MRLKTQKNLASRVLKVGVSRVWFDPLRMEDIKQAITRADIEDLVKERIIRIYPGKKKSAKKTGTKRRAGSRKMRVKNRKYRYVRYIRKVRNYIEHLKERGSISDDLKWKLRGLSKAGQFRNLRHLKEHIKSLSFKEAVSGEEKK